MSAPAAKVCIHCGQDCSAKPRTKDMHGRYACKECHERALQGMRGKDPASAAARPKPAPALAPIEVEPEDNLIASLAQGISGPGTCVACGGGLPQGAAICMNCGTNQATGEQLNTKKLKAPKEKNTSSGPSFAMNPMWIGLGGIAVVLLLAGVAYSSEAMLIPFAALMVLLSLGAFLTTVICAFKDGAPGWGIAAIAQLLIPCVGLAVLYYVFFVNERPMVKVLNAVSIIASIAFVIVSMQHGMTLEDLGAG